MVRAFSRSLSLALLAVASCVPTAPLPDRPPIPTPPERDRQVATAYPTLAELYQGAQGIYRGCGPNGNVCHNARQYPNMNTLGALSLTPNQPCNQLQDDPTRIDDWCERHGDTVRVGGMRFELAYLQRVADRTDTMGSRWAIVVQGALPALTANSYLSVVRVRTGHEDTWLAGFNGDRLTRDPTRDNVVFAQLHLNEDYLEQILERAGVPADGDAIQFGDPNRNGTFGAQSPTHHALVVPGHPENSYLIRRLIDPHAGPLMPLANCCFWSKASLRALWCWIASLNDDGSNAMDPIDYSRCPEGPVENVVYPEPGPTCENGGLCPVHTRDPIPADPTWANVYGNILVPRCGGNGCHRSTSPAGQLDLGTSEVAYQQLVSGMNPRVVPGNPNASVLYQRLVQPCPPGQASCRRMPLYQGPLPDNELQVLNQWIAMGARMDGMLVEPLPTDASARDASEASAPEGGMDARAEAAAPEPAAEAGPEPAGPEAGPESGPEPAMESGADAGADASAMDASAGEAGD